MDETTAFVRKNGWPLDPKFNKHYCGFKHGFFNHGAYRSADIVRKHRAFATLVALGYKQFLDVEDAFRTLKHTLNLRPVYH